MLSSLGGGIAEHAQAGIHGAVLLNTRCGRERGHRECVVAVAWRRDHDRVCDFGRGPSSGEVDIVGSALAARRRRRSPCSRKARHAHHGPLPLLRSRPGGTAGALPDPGPRPRPDAGPDRDRQRVVAAVGARLGGHDSACARPDPLRPGTAVPDDDHSRSSRAAAVRLPVRLRDGAFYRSRIDRGTPPQIVRIMMRRRHWGMILLGLLHAALLFYGDILGAYGLAAVLLVWIFFDRRDRTLRIWICVIAAIMTLFALFSLFGGVMTTLFTPDDVLAEMAAGTQAFSPELLRDLAYAQSYPVTVLVRAGLWVPTTIQGALTMVVPLAIMLGWLAARHRVLDEPWNHVPMLRRLAIGGIALGWLTGLPDALMIAGLLPLPEAVYWMFAGMNYLGGLICGLGYAAAFALLAMRLEGRTAHPGPAPVTDP